MTMEMRSILREYKTLTYYNEARDENGILMCQNVRYCNVDFKDFNEVILCLELHDGTCILNPNLSYEIVSQPYANRDKIILKQNGKQIITLVGKK